MGSQFLSPKVGGTLQQNSIFNTTKGAESARQQSLSLNLWRPLSAVGGRMTLFGLGQIESNPNQGFDLRSLSGGGVGLFSPPDERRLTLVNAGIVADREQVTESTDVTTNAEMLLGLRYSRYRTDFPKYSINLGVSTFTYLTDSPRFRA